MSVPKITLNFLGDKIIIDKPQELSKLRQDIKEKSLSKKLDLDDLILYYTKEEKKIFIKSEEDYKAFEDSNINKINIELNQNSENWKKLNQAKNEDTKKYNELIKQNEEYKKMLSTKFVSQKQEIIDISKQIQELFTKRKKIIQTINLEKDKILKMKKSNDKVIAKLEKKIGGKFSKQMILDSCPGESKKLVNNHLFPKKRNKNNIHRKKSYQDKKIKRISLEKRDKSPIQKTNENIITNLNIKNYKIMNIKRKTSPTYQNFNSYREKKLINFNESKISNNTNPFNEGKEGVKEQKDKSIKISEIISHTIKNISEINNDKNISKKSLLNKEKNNRQKEKKENLEKDQSEKNAKKSEKTNEILNNLMNKIPKYEHLLSHQSKEKIKKSNQNKEEKKNDKAIKNISKNNKK